MLVYLLDETLAVSHGGINKFMSKVKRIASSQWPNGGCPGDPRLLFFPLSLHPFIPGASQSRAPFSRAAFALPLFSTAAPLVPRRKLG